VVLNELERRGAEVGYVKTGDGLEVDFLARHPAGAQELIQVCADLSAADTLARFLLLLDMDVTIRVEPKRRAMPGGRMAVQSSLDALKTRGRRSSREKFLAVLDTVPDAPPRAGDETPAASRVREKASAYRPKRHR
jgi:hypothetical protein